MIVRNQASSEVWLLTVVDTVAADAADEEPRQLQAKMKNSLR
jgi:hypothetical protein